MSACKKLPCSSFFLKTKQGQALTHLTDRQTQRSPYSPKATQVQTELNTPEQCCCCCCCSARVSVAGPSVSSCLYTRTRLFQRRDHLARQAPPSSGCRLHACGKEFGLHAGGEVNQICKCMHAVQGFGAACMHAAELMKSRNCMHALTALRLHTHKEVHAAGRRLGETANTLKAHEEAIWCLGLNRQTKNSHFS